MTEEQVADELAKQLLGRGDGWIWARTRNILSTSKLCNENGDLAKALSLLACPTAKRAGASGSRLVLQPDIDLCLKHEDGRLCAIELKLFRKDEKRKSFHQGLGQALALLAYGVDSAALWFVFEDEQTAKRLGSRAWFLTRNELKLDLDFTPFVRRRDNDGKSEYAIWQYTGPTDCVDTRRTIKSAGVVFHHENPLRLEEPAKTIRDHLDEWLDDPKRDRRLLASQEGHRTDGPKGLPPLDTSSPQGPTGPCKWPSQRSAGNARCRSRP